MFNPSKFNISFNIKPSPTRWCHHFILYLINHKILTKTHWRSTTILQRFPTNFDADLATKSSLRIGFCFYFIMVSSLNGFVQVQLNIHSLLQRLPVVGPVSSWRYNLRLDNSGQTPALAATADSNRSGTGWVWSLFNYNTEHRTLYNIQSCWLKPRYWKLTTQRFFYLNWASHIKYFVFF